MPGFAAYIFDFDGVLADSLEVKTRAFAALFEPFGDSVCRAVVEHHRGHGGMPRAEKFRLYYREFLGRTISDVELDDLCGRFSQMVIDEVAACPEIPGARDFLERRCATAACFVDSAVPDQEIRDIVRRRGLDGFFAQVLGSSRSKVENLRLILAGHGLSAARCLFFGDALSDWRAARDCGVSFVGIAPGPDAALVKAVPGLRWFPDFTAVKDKDI
ncbi:MAG: HAD family hydrolase [Desulfovibrionaceae bacterium]|nr:HAD family hydrolase [Desulfovibrionaceae bacterium]